MRTPPDLAAHRASAARPGLALAAALGLALAGPPPPALAQDVSTIYRCLGRDGAERLQDQPCADGETSEMRRIEVPAAAAPPARVASTATAAEDPAPAPPAAAPPLTTRRVEAPTLPELWECAGVEQPYFSADGRGRARRVPAWVLEEGRAHAPRAERPGDRRLPPPAPPPGTPPPETRPGVLLAPTVDIEDHCRLLPVRERCARRGEDGVPADVAEALGAACGR